jgi:uncharacterized membrane protein
VREFYPGKPLKHLLHPILVYFSISLWPIVTIFDILANFGIGGKVVVQLSFYTILFGLAATLIAMPIGLARWGDIKPNEPGWEINLYYMLLNVVAALLWLVNFDLRTGVALEATSVPGEWLMLSAMGLLLLLVSGYLGSLMVYDEEFMPDRLPKRK